MSHAIGLQEGLNPIEKKAFPSQNYTRTGNVEMSQPAQYGMDLRDWFAGQALAGELSAQGEDGGWWTSDRVNNLAHRCYLIADSMMKEREKNNV